MPDPLKYLTAFVIILFVSQTGKTQSKDPDPPAKSHVPDEKKAEVTDTGMAPKVRYLDTVYVTGRKPLLENRDGKTILNVASSILASGSNALEILSRAPGVTVDHDGNISFRGRPGITIMIDGKPTFLSPGQLTSLLRSTQGNTIQTIEIISNPSAKYDASGTGGIIDIRLKKNTSFGTNGNFDIGAGYGSYHKSGVGFSLNHRNRSFNFFGDFNYENNRQFVDLHLMRSSQNARKMTFFDQDARQIDRKNTLNYKIGIDYHIDDNQILGFMIKSYVNNSIGENKIKTLVGDAPETYNSSVKGNNSDKSEYKGQTYNLNYQAVLDTLGRQFNADLDFASVRNKEDVTYSSVFSDVPGLPNNSPDVFRNVSPASINIMAAKLDYTHPFDASMTLESGLKSSYVRSGNNFRSANFIDGTWLDDASRTNKFAYQENINAAYLNLRTNLASATLEIGIRTELTHSEGKSVTLQEKVRRNYIDFFPNLSVNKTLSDIHSVGIAYSRRIERPDYQSLNPFVYYTDVYTRLQGNPALKPEYANSFDVNYQYRKKFNLSFGYIRTKDVMTTTLITDTAKKTLLLYEQNLASRRTLSASIGAPISLTSWWSTANDFTIYRSRFASPDLMGMPFKNEKTTFTINTNHTVDISSTLNAELSGSYTSSQVYGTYVARSIYGFDIGINKALSNKRANIKLSINDVFNQREIKIKSAIPFQDYQLAQKEESRRFRLTFSYNFGSNKIKESRSRPGSSSNEQERIRSGK